MTDSFLTPSDLLKTLSNLSSHSDEENLSRKIPPIHNWFPKYCGDIGMEIRRDGSWWHEGQRITRHKLVNLFSTILRKEEDEKIYLVTPHEKVIVHVEDAPFIAVRTDQFESKGQNHISFLTNMGDQIILNEANPLRVEIDPKTGEPSPYVMIRYGLEAKIARAPFYELVEYSVAGKGKFYGQIGVWSMGSFYALGIAE